LFDSQQFGEAARVCDESLVLLPNSSELHFFRSEIYARAGEKALAIASCRRALNLDPGLLSAQQRLSLLLFEAGQLEEAEASYRREIELTPQHYGPYHQLGVVLMKTARNAQAVEQFKLATSLNPASAASYVCLGNAYMEADDPSGKSLELAQASFEKAIVLEPKVSDFHCSMGFCYWMSAQLDRAVASFEKAIELNAGNVKARWARVMLWAPAFAAKGSEDPRGRAGFANELAKFQDWWSKSDAGGDLFVGELQPFFLAYQEESNLALLKQYGQVCAMAMQRFLEREPAPPLLRPTEKRIRLGIVSADIRMHSVWLALIKGWLKSFDRTQFEIVIFSLAAEEDPETTWARSKSDLFFDGPKSVSQWVAEIRGQNCEILLYPAVGLDPLTLKLASLRLAPVQLNTWGHPDTSGLPTLDYYLSADCFEPADAQDQYSEQLVLLPHLGNRMDALSVPNVEPVLASMHLDPARPILVCPGTPYKYQPVNDHVFADIARAVPSAQLVFFRGASAALADLLQTRITKEFQAAGLDAKDHVRFIRWLSFSEFHSLLRRADVLLDTIGFSGYNTAVQAMECGLPLVTREGRFLRGRLASGVLRRIGLPELIAQTKAEYVSLVARLVSDRGYRTHIRQEIEQRRPVLFDDQSAMGPFQDFLRSIARRS
jgi:predicted O-linked N-acetylglucosamine transferase (SPINDLY family)